MEKNILEQYEERLKKEKENLEKEISRDDVPPDFGIDPNEIEDKAEEVAAFTDQLAMANDLKKRLIEVDAALEKIQNGTYGKCENCGKEIEEDVLDIAPESKFCKECKLKLE